MAEGVEDAGKSEGSAVMAGKGRKSGNTQPERVQTSGGSQRSDEIGCLQPTEMLDGAS